MSATPFASLHAGMLVRKGAATPSLEAAYPAAPRPLAQVVQAVAPAAPALQPSAPAPTSLRMGAPASASGPAAPPTPTVRVKLTEAPPPAAASASAPAAARPRASVRLTPAQSRALKLAALLLDKPQQELLAAGLDLRLEGVACGPLAHCACFRAAVGKLAAG